MSNTEKIPSSDLLETANLVIFRIIRLDGEEIIRSKTSCRNKLVRKILLPGVNWAAMTNSGNEKQQEIRQVLRLRIGPTDVRRSPIGSGRTSHGLRRTSDRLLRVRPEFRSPTELRSGVRCGPPDVRYDPRTYFDDSRTQSFYLKSESDFDESDSSPTGSDRTQVKPEIAV